jgi:hypothetical protein
LTHISRFPHNPVAFAAHTRQQARAAKRVKQRERHRIADGARRHLQPLDFDGAAALAADENDGNGNDDGGNGNGNGDGNGNGGGNGENENTGVRGADDGTDVYGTAHYVETPSSLLNGTSNATANDSGASSSSSSSSSLMTPSSSSSPHGGGDADGDGMLCIYSGDAHTVSGIRCALYAYESVEPHRIDIFAEAADSPMLVDHQTPARVTFEALHTVLSQTPEATTSTTQTQNTTQTTTTTASVLDKGAVNSTHPLLAAAQRRRLVQGLVPSLRFVQNFEFDTVRLVLLPLSEIDLSDASAAAAAIETGAGGGGGNGLRVSSSATHIDRNDGVSGDVNNLHSQSMSTLPPSSSSSSTSSASSSSSPSSYHSAPLLQRRAKLALRRPVTSRRVYLVGGATALVTYVCSLLFCSLGGATALVTLVVCYLHSAHANCTMK